MRKESRFYFFDRQAKSFVKHTLTAGRVLIFALKWLFVSLLSAVTWYLIFALVWNTDREKELIESNRTMRSDIAEMRVKLDSADSVVAHIVRIDSSVYNALFSTNPPKFESDVNDALLNAFKMVMKSELVLIDECADVISNLEERTASVEKNLESIRVAMDSLPYSLKAVPSTAPLSNLSLLQVGASTGQKVSPFQKTLHAHTGIDLMAPAGTEVICTADGSVTGIERSGRGMGNRVTVTHRGGYVTTYSHLDEIKVSLGRRLQQGDVVGTVGSTGSQFAICLHYEVLLNGEYQDPSCYFFAVEDPATYRKIVTTARVTGQSMD